MTTKPPEFSDINALAMEACDMWQEHLSNLANNPTARAELTRFLEPQRRLFADWASMMRQGGTDDPNRAKEDPSATKNSASPDPSAAGASASAAASGGTAHGDDPLRVAQLALRLAELEKRVAELESRGSDAPK
jgi:hypothetical protein